MADRRKRIKRDSLGRRTDRVKKREEAAMLRLQLSGLTPKEIAAKLNRKVETVRRHLASKDKEKMADQGKIVQVVPRELFFEIRKLAKRLEQLTHIPEPHRAFLRDDVQFVPKNIEEIMKADTSQVLSTYIVMGTPWWTATGPVEIRRHLRFEEEALLNHFIGLPTSQECRADLANWEERANTYIQLKRSNADAEVIQSAYLEARKAEIAFHSELWAAVEALRWSS